jgi:long-chain acyl-CoA synthetase
MLQDMMEHPDFAKRNLSSMKSVGAGGAPTPKAQVFRVNKAFKMVGRPGQGYGLTETNGAVCSIAGDAYVLKPTSTGPPFPIVEAKCVDLETGQDCKQGDRGELYLRSTLVMTCYWNNKKATEEVLTPDAWFKSGDVAILDKENFVYIVDRAKQIIIRGGENISCAEVEAGLMHNTAVMEACVFGLPDDRLGEKVAAMVLLKQGATLTAQALHASVRELLASFKVPLPADIYFSTTPLPRGATGKTQKRDVREAVLKQLKTKSSL